MSRIDLNRLPYSVMTYIVELRRENAKYRRERNQARDEASDLRSQLATLHAGR